jgi:curved DNA-binding protein CbpA
MINAYTLLGLTNEATQDEIKTAYRKLAQQNHPDRGGKHDVFVKIQTAYDILSDPVRRKHYDATGETTIAPDLSQARIYGYLSAMMLQLIEQTDENITDIVKAMRNTININKANNELEINTIRARITKREKVIARMIRTDGGDNILTTFISTDNVRQKAQLEAFLTGINDFNKMLQMLEDYVYNTPPPPPPPSFFTTVY